jgi:hypothetical protein
MVGIALGGVAVGGYLLVNKDDGREGGAGSAASALPAGWSLCTNRARGFAIGYPRGWDEKRASREPRCESSRGTALQVYTSSDPLDYSIHVLTRPEWGMSRDSVEKVSIARSRARRVQATSIGGAGWAWPRGTRVYAYVVEQSPEKVVVIQTITAPGKPGHAARKHVVDTAARTLSFYPLGDKTGTCRVPNLAGLELEAGRVRIRERNCSVGKIRRTRSSRAGLIIEQSPRHGAHRRPGFLVDLLVGRR